MAAAEAVVLAAGLVLTDWQPTPMAVAEAAVTDVLRKSRRVIDCGREASCFIRWFG